MANHEQNDIHQIGKRPFCNAFTGCGRKRSADTDRLRTIENEIMADNAEFNLYNPVDPYSDTTMTNTEPMVEDLMRQILSQVKLWEAIQEANQDYRNRNYPLKYKNRYPLAFSTQ